MDISLYIYLNLKQTVMKTIIIRFNKWIKEYGYLLPVSSEFIIDGMTFQLQKSVFDTKTKTLTIYLKP